MADSEHHDLISYIPRLGYFAKGMVYLLVGVLATLVAVGGRGQVGGSRDALKFLEQAPASSALLGLLAVGLLGYAVWRLAQGVVDPENERDGDASGLVARIRAVGSGIVHVGLAIYAGKLALNMGSGGGSSWSASLMQTDIGPFLVGGVGVVVACTGIYQFYKAYSADFLNKLKTQKMPEKARDVVKKLGEAGHIARGFVFLLVGWFLVDAAMTRSSSEAANAGLGEALNTIATQPYGTVLLGLAAVGVASYGVFCSVKGYYRRLAF